MKTICVKIKLKPGSLDKVIEWAKELNRREDEAYDTLRDEGIFIESAFLDKTPQGDYLVYFMKLEDVRHAGKVASRSVHAIDAYHKKFKLECWDSKSELELLIDFDRYAEKFR